MVKASIANNGSPNWKWWKTIYEKYDDRPLNPFTLSTETENDCCNAITFITSKNISQTHGSENISVGLNWDDYEAERENAKCQKAYKSPLNTKSDIRFELKSGNIFHNLCRYTNKTLYIRNGKYAPRQREIETLHSQIRKNGNNN